MDNYLVISAVGEDQPGIVNALSEKILESGCNIIDTRMTVLGGEFAILMMVSGSWNTVAKLESSMSSLEKQLNLTIIAKQTEPRDQSSKKIPYMIEVVAMDHPGIVNNVAEFFSSRNINIEDLSTGSYSAAHTGTTMFTMHMVISIPAESHLGDLREHFTEFCDNLNLDAIMEPVKN